MTFKRHQLEKYDPCKRDPDDKRKFIAWAVFSYIDTDTGDEYRKSFKSKANTPEMTFWKMSPEVLNL